MATEFNTQVSDGEYRLQFETDNEAHYLLMQSAARRCVDCEHMTNADRVRAMTDEELARWLEYEGGGACAEMCGWLNWLQQPAEEGK